MAFKNVKNVKRPCLFIRQDRVSMTVVVLYFCYTFVKLLQGKVNDLEEVKVENA